MCPFFLRLVGAVSEPYLASLRVLVFTQGASAMGYLTRKMGRRTGWATAAMLLLLAGTSRAQSDPTQVTIDANGEVP
jgi:hypothetical protein